MAFFHHRRELSSGFLICPIINGLWQTSGGHGQIVYSNATKVLKELYDNGFTTFDGADHYGPAEDLMGDLWSGLGDKATPQNTQMFTKWCPSPKPMSEIVVRKAIEKSLSRMKTNCIHLLQFHWWDYNNNDYITALKHMQTLQKEGKILHLALTNFNTKHLQIIVENNKIPIVSNQVSYSIIDWRPELEMVPFCLKHNIKLLTYGTILGGFLSNQYLGVNKPKIDTSSKYKYIRFIESWGGWVLFQELLKTLDQIGKKYDVSIANVATRYILDKPAVGGVIVGVRPGLSSHIDDNKKVFDFTLDDADRAEIERVAKKGKVLPGDCGDEYR